MIVGQNMSPGALEDGHGLWRISQTQLLQTKDPCPNFFMTKSQLLHMTIYMTQEIPQCREFNAASIRPGNSQYKIIPKQTRLIQLIIIIMIILECSIIRLLPVFIYSKFYT